MTTGRLFRLLLLLPTLWLPFYTIAFMVIVSTGSPPVGFSRLWGIHIATMILNMLLMIGYVVHLFRSKQVADDRRTLWGLALFLGAPVAMPIYWYAHVWRDRGDSAAR